MLLTIEEQVTAEAASEGQKLRLAGQLVLSCFALHRYASQTCIACCGLRLENVTGLVLLSLDWEKNAEAAQQGQRLRVAAQLEV